MRKDDLRLCLPAFCWGIWAVIWSPCQSAQEYGNTSLEGFASRSKHLWSNVLMYTPTTVTGDLVSTDSNVLSFRSGCPRSLCSHHKKGLSSGSFSPSQIQFSSPWSLQSIQITLFWSKTPLQQVLNEQIVPAQSSLQTVLKDTDKQTAMLARKAVISAHHQFPLWYGFCRHCPGWPLSSPPEIQITPGL